MKSKWMILGAIVLAGLTACATMQDDEEDEREIPLSEVPQAVQDAAKAAVPGIVLSEAEVETEDGKQVFCVFGIANGQEYEVEATPEGKVLEVEKEDGDDEDDDDEDDDDK